MRFVPFSYFCTCWKVRPSFSPSFSWLIPSISLRMRTREPTYLSVGFGDFFAIIIGIRPQREVGGQQVVPELAKQGQVAKMQSTSQSWRYMSLKPASRFISLYLIKRGLPL